MAIINVRFVGKSPAGGRLARVRRGSKLVVKPTKCPFLRKVWDRHRQSSGGRTSAGRSTGLESPHWWKDQLIAGLGLVVPRRVELDIVFPPWLLPPSPSHQIPWSRNSAAPIMARLQHCGDMRGFCWPREKEINSEHFQPSPPIRSMMVSNGSRYILDFRQEAKQIYYLLIHYEGTKYQNHFLSRKPETEQVWLCCWVQAAGWLGRWHRACTVLGRDEETAF